MIVIGLTGGIAMGKSTLSRQFGLLGAKIINADAVVHQLLATGGAGVLPVSAAFAGVIKNDAIDRKALGKIVFNNETERKKLEAILHPLVVAAEEKFVAQMERLGAKYVVMDIPLLFETGAENRCDVTVLASAPHFIQRQRVLARGISEDVFHRIVKAQMPELEKRDRADFIVPTGLGKAYSFACVKEIIMSFRPSIARGEICEQDPSTTLGMT
ncbi:MAG: dephospho-CoA kinase [Alphaproteobacteria bacterium]|nr:dephospho-CoA kinase [Alphaproteobacteria bacterium]